MSLVHMVLDEAAALGHMEAIDDMLGLGRGYGLRVHLFFQNAAQLMRCYPDGQHQFVMGTTTNIFFGAHDWVTCEEISKRTGSQTVVVDSGGHGDGDSRQSADGGGPGSVGTSRNRSRNWAYAGQPLLRPEQVAALPARAAITFAPGVPAPVLTWLTRYYEEPAPPTNHARLAVAAGSLLRATTMAAAGVAAAVLAATVRVETAGRTAGDPTHAGRPAGDTPTRHAESEGDMARNRLWAFLKKVGRDIDDQFWNRTGPHGAAELGAGLFNGGHAYVMYGHAGRPGDPGPAQEQQRQQQQGKAETTPEPEPQPDREKGGRER